MLIISFHFYHLNITHKSLDQYPWVNIFFKYREPEKVLTFLLQFTRVFVPYVV